MSILKPSQAVGIGLATAGLVVGIHMTASPSIADVKVNDPQDPNLAGVERAATWKAASIVAVISLLTRDPTVLTIGGLTVIGMSALYRHANAFNPVTGTAATRPALRVVDNSADDYLSTVVPA